MWLFFELQAMAAVHSLERSLNTAKGKFEALLDVMLCWNPVVTLSSVWPLIIGIQVILYYWKSNLKGIVGMGSVGSMEPTDY